MAVFDELLTEVEREMLAEAENVFGGQVKKEETPVVFKQVMSVVPHGNLKEVIPQYQKMREKMGRDFLALALLAGGYPPESQPFLTGRDNKVAVAAALLTCPETVPWWRVARLLGQRQFFGMDVRNALETVRASRMFSPRARRHVNNAAQKYVDRLQMADGEWENRVLADSKSLKALIEYTNASVDSEYMAVLRDRKAWDSKEWPRLKTAREFARLVDSGDYGAAGRLLEKTKLPLLFVEGCADITRPEIAAAVLKYATPKQVMARLNKLTRSGVLKDPAVFDTVVGVLRKAVGDNRVAPADIRRVREFAAGIDPGLAGILEEVEAKKRERLYGNSQVDLTAKETCLIVDKSGSMDEAIRAAGQLAAYFADQGAVVKAVRFDTKAYQITPEIGKDGRPDWKGTFSMLTANGGTSIGAGLNKAADIASDADLWVVLTDGGDNTHPLAGENSPKPEHGRVAVMWFNWDRPASGFQRWLQVVGADEFRPQTRDGRLDYAALDDLVRLALAGDRLDEWIATLPVSVVEKLVG
ncbi:hypothetical protein SAMN02745218_02966 [Desulfofundulus australicus DSM 11792]|uniref:Uncharacterized protein n=1 Tax=Desulfofundulus australicus DSM 11792 TaxID=1121425 RepID=A0A1M5E166_9FIRM|nr:vWA domain-containing protein [Desulfofundulus australicus]SHF72864.1 hypothetical protein SAMN02745218_02966 [Desulfofundulus australicus DSM 11792]